MGRISSGVKDLDALLDSFYVGDNVLWEVEAGTSVDVFIKNFIRQSALENQSVIYLSFNKSPQSVLQQLGEAPSAGFILLDCFTSGKGKNDRAFTKFFDSYEGESVRRVERPGDIAYLTDVLNSIEDSLPPGARYIFDSLTGMQDLWGDDQSTYKFFTYMCPRLYDLETVAYWVLEKEAHTQAFRANLRHITQVVLELYKKKDRLYIKSLKLEGRTGREAYKPHPYGMDGESVSISAARREPLLDIGTRIKETRTTVGMSQKELAERVDLTPSFISQLESNQISPSLNSFVQICGALGMSPEQFLKDVKAEDPPWYMRKEKVLSRVAQSEDGLKGYSIFKNGKMSGSIYVIETGASLIRHVTDHKGKELIHLIKGNISVTVEGRTKALSPGDSVVLRGQKPSQWKNEGGDKAELLVVCL